MEELNEGWQNLTTFARYALCSTGRLRESFLYRQGSNTVRVEPLCLINKLEVQLFNVIFLFNSPWLMFKGIALVRSMQFKFINILTEYAIMSHQEYGSLESHQL